MAPIVTFQSDSPQALLDQAADIVRRGGVLAIPTDSYYGLGASPFDDTAVGRVCRIKGHADGKPILVLIANLEQLADLIDDMTPAAALLMKRFWPGPLTIVMHASKRLPTLLTAGTGTIGVRQPTTPILARLLRHVGPLTGTSANRTGHSPAETAEGVQSSLGTEVDLILDGGATPGGLPSTVVEATESVRVLRDGPVTRDQLQGALSALHIALVS